MELFWKKKNQQQKHKEILQDRQLPILLKTKQTNNNNNNNKPSIVMDQCVLPTMTYGCQTWSLNKQLTKTENRSKSNGEENVESKATR